jgi:hypothetical protein
VKSSQREEYWANDSLRLQWKEGGSDNFLGPMSGTRELQELENTEKLSARALVNAPENRKQKTGFRIQHSKYLRVLHFPPCPPCELLPPAAIWPVT